MNRRVAVAISGGGRSLANLLKLQANFRYEIAAVIASSPACKGLTYAEQSHLPILICDFRAQTPELSNKLSLFLAKNQIDWIALAGFLKKFPMLPRYEGKTINIHPALLPDFGGPGMYGNKVHQAVAKAGHSTTGASIHIISDHYDEGPLVSQIMVDISDLTDADAIADRVFSAECQLYPKTLDKLVSAELPLPHQDIWMLRYQET